MPESVASPPLAPIGFDVDVYIVLDDFGSIGRSYRETAEEGADRESLVRDLIDGQYNNPVRIVCFNTAKGTSRDATLEIAHELQNRVSRKGEKITPGLRDFIEWELDRTTRIIHDGGTFQRRM
jgi:hypothetical protein